MLRSCLAVLLVLGLVSACSSPTGSSSVTGLSLNYTGANLEVGASPTTQLLATVSPSSANQSVSWSSGNTSVATVSSNGLVTAVAAGTALVTATASDNKTTATCGVAVWQIDGSYLKYYSNDPTFYGWSFWHGPVSTANVSTLTAPLAKPITLVINKVTGASDEGLGVHFFEQGSGNYYRFELYLNTKKYRLRKAVSGTLTDLVPATDNQYINSVGTANTIVIWQPSAGEVSVTINSHPAITNFSDSTYTSGQIAFYASNGLPSDTVPESFPGTPEYLQFQLTSPFTYPASP